MTVTELIVGVLLIAGALAIHLVVHEAAHALAALALGMGVAEMELGGASRPLQLRLGSTTIRVGGFHSGITRLDPRSSKHLRARLALTALAGPMSNVALAGAVYLLVNPPLWSRESFASLLVAGGLLIGVLNLIPFRLPFERRDAHTDGAVVLSLMRADSSIDKQLVALGGLTVAHRRHLAGETVTDDGRREPVDHSDPVVLGMEGTRRILTGDFDEAIALLREAAAMPQPDDNRALTLSNLAWVLLLAQPDGWLDEADHASAQAIALLPHLSRSKAPVAACS